MRRIMFVWILIFSPTLLLGNDGEMKGKNRVIIDKLKRFESIAKKIKTYDEVAWNPLYRKAYFDIVNSGREAIPYLLQDSQNKRKDIQYRYFAMEFLASLKDLTWRDRVSIYRGLMDIIEDKEEDLVLRKKAVFSLCRTAVKGKNNLEEKPVRQEICSRLIRILTNKNEPDGLRWQIADLLHVFDDMGDMIIEALSISIKDDNKDIRAISAVTLSSVGVTAKETERLKVGDILLARLTDEKDRLVQEQIVSGMKVMKDRRIIPYLMESLKDERYCNRVEAVEVLGLFKVQEAVPELIRIVKDGERDALLVSNACIALGRIGDRNAIEPMRKVLKESRYGAYHGAAIGLAMLGAREATEDIEEKFLSLDGFDETLAMALLVLGGKGKVEVVKRKAGRNLRRLGGIKEVIKTVEEGKGIDIQLIERFVRR